MDDEIRIVIEKFSVTSQTVTKRDIVKIYDLKKPASILELGLCHQEQIALLTKIQNAILAEQATLIDPKFTICPKCGQKVSKNGFMRSIFHAVFSDHKLRLQKHRCTNPDCGWQSTPTTLTEFGTDTHPDLAKLQCEQGATNSYRVAQTNLEKLNCQRRSVNNHVQVRATTNRIGERLAAENGEFAKPVGPPATQLVVHLERGLVPVQSQDQTEVLLGMIYRLDKPPNKSTATQVITPTYVASAIADDQKTFETYLLNACLRQGLSSTTQLYGLIDHASYCSNILTVLQPYVRTLEPLLDWYHVVKQFDVAQQDLSALLAKFLERAKHDVWNGQVDEALIKIEFMQAKLSEKTQLRRVNALQTYLQVNHDYLVHYSQWEEDHKPFTSEAIAIHVDTLIEARSRQRRTRWTYEGAHNLLQIRAAMASHSWDERWPELVMRVHP
ncbi:ISKra4 family transposase [Acaryochloris sp. IP29b_bin.148]|uniref:ISKra4 family transposase n=1 Tax=Acaryochloris sp. IP29b_bin.148 TaxID=2969218 RepID=UPI00263216B3|nr:ISKra4 family transposase [Acaryochloris sp. IP29b_bin.148]